VYCAPNDGIDTTDYDQVLAGTSTVIVQAKEGDPTALEKLRQVVACLVNERMDTCRHRWNSTPRTQLDQTTTQFVDDILASTIHGTFNPRIMAYECPILEAIETYLKELNQ